MINEVFAQDQLDLNEIQSQGLPGFRFTTIGSVITAAIPYIFFFAGVALLLYIIMGGYTLMTSRGDQKAIAAGKERITHGLIGFIIVFTAFWVVQLVGNLLGLPDFNSIFGGQGPGLPPPVPPGGGPS